jgi:hypothetical protein
VAAGQWLWMTRRVAACAAVERMATRMELQADEHDAMALQRLAAKLPNVNHLNCAAREEAVPSFVKLAGLLGEFSASRPNSAAGLRSMRLVIDMETRTHGSTLGAGRISGCG